ncbi:MAG: histidine kinase [Oscillospiraceae bacterium]|nr:histidine kinase [Oscillospiraceae bacterium]
MNELELSTEVLLIVLGAAIMLALLGLVVSVVMPASDRWNKRFFIAYFTVLVLYIGFCTADAFTYRKPDMAAAQTVIYYCETLFCTLLLPMLTAYILRCCGEDWQRSPVFRLAAALWGLSFVMLNLAPFTTWFYYVTPENSFCRGPLYPLAILIPGSVAILNLACVIRWRNRLSRRYFAAFLIGLLPIVLTLLVHLISSVFDLFGISISICALSMFLIILYDQGAQILRQEREIANQRASIAVLQMRPHFIYNTMMSIYYLCRQDPDLAQRVILDFTAYLRKNFTAIASDGLIPFSEELEHTRAYLAVEQAQFDDRLFVDYDTPHTDFSVPPLTLQPIVENAVKHGMDPDGDPLHIQIRTRRTDSGSEITVENSGASFEPADDGEPHIALGNIRQRLEMMCRGQMTITPREGGGTVVQVTIP